VPSDAWRVSVKPVEVLILILIPDAMDSHMHLDRSLRRLRLDPSVRHPSLSRRSTWWGGGLL
jgi:hypothetical protein